MATGFYETSVFTQSLFSWHYGPCRTLASLKNVTHSSVTQALRIRLLCPTQPKIRYTDCRRLHTNKFSRSQPWKPQISQIYNAKVIYWVKTKHILIINTINLVTCFRSSNHISMKTEWDGSYQKKKISDLHLCKYCFWFQGHILLQIWHGCRFCQHI